MSTVATTRPRHLRLVTPLPRLGVRTQGKATTRRTVTLLLGSTALLVVGGTIMVLSASSVTANGPVATAATRTPSARAQAMSRGVSPITSISDAENCRPCFSIARARATVPSRLRS